MFRQAVGDSSSFWEVTSASHLAGHVLEALFAGLAELYLAAPLGLEDLGGGDSPPRVGV
jgi:hypothetical protein